MKRKHREHLEDLQTAWEDVAPDLENRWRASSKRRYVDWFMHKRFDSFSRETARAYKTAKAVDEGLPPSHLTSQAVRETMQTASMLSEEANELVGHSDLADLLHDNKRLGQQLRVPDLPKGELAVLRALGVDTTDEEVEQLFRRVRSRARTPQDEQHNIADVYAGDVFRRAQQILDNEMTSDEEEQDERPKPQFFTGIRKVIFGSTLIVGDVGLAFGFPVQVFVQPEYGWTTLSSIIGGLDIGWDGVESLWKGRKA